MRDELIVRMIAEKCVQGRGDHPISRASAHRGTSDGPPRFKLGYPIEICSRPVEELLLKRDLPLPQYQPQVLRCAFDVLPVVAQSAKMPPTTTFEGRQLMSLFAVTREAGPGWTEGKGAFEQPHMNDHAAFMNNLAEEGFVLCAGPLAGSEHDRIRVLLIVEAASEADINYRLGDDPWALTQRLVIRSVEAWNLLVGAERLGSGG